MNTWFSGLARVASRAVPALLGVGLLAGCVSDGAAEENVSPESAADSSLLTAEELRQELRALAREVGDGYGGRVGIAVATADGVTHVGLTGNSWSWSTIKVPVAVVADREEVATEALIGASISSSDNAAAYQLSRAIDGDLGDLPHTPELEALPGETKWSLVEQAQFAAELPCLDTVGTTYAAMADIVDWQQYGLAEIPDAHFKGGWGGDTSRVYTVRQLGTVPVGKGVVGLAVITHPDDNSHDTAVEILDAVGSGLAELIEAGAIGPAVTCRS
ncbi:MAG: hypothetical protein GX859_00850 [Corynebacterium humireducens]|uniref:Uncharacterized protein n=1 Tax=Corynebacterium humireducens TaxID=1223514 RepID=A0A7X6PLJ1_9CORY|nr:hypothetical protein [Corynebacterium humireducens]